MIYFCISLITFSFGCAKATFPVSLTAFVGLNFKQFLTKEDFFPVENVKFAVSLDGLPDLPPWMKLEQKDALSEAILYGTPDISSVGTVKLEVIAWNKETYETKRTVCLLTVIDINGSNIVSYQLEFYIKNKNLPEILFEDFANVVKRVWSNADYVTLVEKPSERNGGSYPLPGQKEGVYVTVGGSTPVPKDFNVLKSTCADISSEYAAAKIFINAGYQVDWCTLREVTQQSLSIQNSDTNFLPTDMYEPALLETIVYDKQAEYLTTDIVFVFIPLAIGLALIVTLTCSMCFARDGIEGDTIGHTPLLKNNKNENTFNINPNVLTYGQLNKEKTGSRSVTSHQPNSNVHGIEKMPLPPVYRNPPNKSNWKDSKL